MVVRAVMGDVAEMEVEEEEVVISTSGFGVMFRPFVYPPSSLMLGGRESLALRVWAAKADTADMEENLRKEVGER